MRAGYVDPLGWWPYVCAAAILAGAAARILGHRRSSALIAVWTFLGSWAAVLVLCSVAAQSSPPLDRQSITAHIAQPREPLAIMSSLDLFWGQSRTLAELERGFAIDRLDVLSRSTLADHERLLLAQPRLLAPEELVALDSWIRDGGRAVVLADPLLLWPSDLAMGDRRRPPVTSLLDPLLAHWGLRLEPATSSLRRRFSGNGRLLLMPGSSRFTITRSAYARCERVGDGWSVTCRVGSGKVRLIADADLLDDRVWQTADGPSLTADNIALIDRWLRRPTDNAAGWNDARIWVRSERDVTLGLRWALLTLIIWAMMGGAGLYALKKRTDARSNALQ
ncbi:MAG: Gldg family protein [Sphingobium sp.]